MILLCGWICGLFLNTSGYFCFVACLVIAFMFQQTCHGMSTLADYQCGFKYMINRLRELHNTYGAQCLMKSIYRTFIVIEWVGLLSFDLSWKVFFCLWFIGGYNVLVESIEVSIKNYHWCCYKVLLEVGYVLDLSLEDFAYWSAKRGCFNLWQNDKI